MSDSFDVERLKRSSKRGIFTSIFGVLIVLAGFAFSAKKLSDVNAEIEKLEADKSTKNKELDSLDKLIFKRTEDLNLLQSISDMYKNEADSLLRLNAKENEYKLLLSAAVDSASKGNFKSAIELYSRLLQKRPNDWKVLQFRGYAYYRENEFSSARKDLEEVLKDTNASHSDALFTLVLVEAKDNHEGLAVKYSKDLKNLDQSAFNLLRSSVPSSLRSNPDFVELSAKRKTDKTLRGH